MTSIELDNISKTYPNGFHAVKSASFRVEPGEFLVLVGPSGCGKSTLLRMIAGLESISSGELKFDGKRMNETEPKNRDVGMVFQNYALYPHLNVFDNIAFPLSVQKVKKPEITKRVNEIAELLELGSYLKSKPKELSGGQRQRVALGRALVRTPKLFLFDEPLSNLDAQLRVQMRTEIINLQRKFGVTSVYVTHDQTEAMTMGTRIAVLKSGEIQQIASPEELYNNPANTFVAGFLGNPQINFFDCELIRNQGVECKITGTDTTFTFKDDDFANYLAKEFHKPTLGLRPEKLYAKHSLEGYQSYIQSEVVNIEYLGHEKLIFFSIGKELKCARAAEDFVANIGENIYFCFDAASLLVFDANGERIYDK